MRAALSIRSTIRSGEFQSAPPIRICRGISEVQGRDRGACAAIGNFDGVHLGHRSVIDLARDATQTNGGPLGVVTFEPHPRAFFTPDATPFRLIDGRTRAKRLARLGVQNLFELTFDKVMASLTPEDFARDIICEGLGLRHVVVGANFRFGKDRSGNTDTLRSFGERFGFGVTIAPLKNDHQERISSTSIRDALAAGNPRLATLRLGEFHSLEGQLHCIAPQSFSLTLMENGRLRTDILLPRDGQYSISATIAGQASKTVLRGIALVRRDVNKPTKPTNILVTLLGGGTEFNGASASVSLIDYHG